MAKVFVITGPSGVGKGTLISRLIESRPDAVLSISATTRAPRPGEQEGVDYFFCTQEQFDKMVAERELLEYATYIGNSYGSPKSWIERKLDAGHSVVLEIDLQGARQVRRSMPEAVQIFIKPPSFGDLRERLVGRETDSQAAIEARLKAAKGELEAVENGEFDEVVVNDDVDRASQELIDLVNSYLAAR